MSTRSFPMVVVSGRTPKVRMNRRVYLRWRTRLSSDEVKAIRAAKLKRAKAAARWTR